MKGQVVITVINSNIFQRVIEALDRLLTVCDIITDSRKSENWPLEGVAKRDEMDNLEQVEKTRQFFIPPLTQMEWCA